jgi:outer membrane protein assembly factor BamB
MQIQPPFRMDGVVKPERPARFEGVNVSPLNQGHDELYRGGGDLKWNLPREEGFDKISFRTRFEPDAQYLLLDGIACGSHGHRDANCLIRFTDNDRVWLVDDSYTEGPFLSDHNGVLVIRDGIAQAMPALARLDAAVDFDEVGIARTTLPDHSGVDWERNVVWIKEKCFVVLDRMKAVQPGNYGIRCQWRTLGTATLEGNRLTTRQEATTPERKDAMHLVFGGDVRASFAEDREDFGGRWGGRYEHAEPVVNIHRQDTTCELAVSESFTFANLFYTTNIAEPHDFGLAKIDDATALVTGEERMLTGMADDGSTFGGVSLRAGPFVLRQQSLTAAAVTSLTIDDNSVLTSETPVALSFDLRDRKLLVQADMPTRATVLGEVRSLKKGQTAFEANGIARSSFAGEVDEFASRSQQGPPATEQGARTTPANVSVAWEFDVGSAVHALLAAGDHVVAGTQDGTGLLLDAHGKPLWRIKTEDSINAVSVGDLNGNGRNEYVFASEDAHVYAVDSSGEELWRFRCPRYAKRSGKLGQARDVLVADLDGDRSAEVVVGANNIELHILDGDGEQLRSFHGSDPKMTFSNFSVVDLDSDGTSTILAFPSSGSFGYGMEFDLGGHSDRFSTDGWPSHIRDRAGVDLDGDAKRDFACATNRGNVYYRLQTDNGLSNRKVFSIGCPVTAMAGLTQRGRLGRVAIGIDASYIHVLDGEGSPVWKQPTGSPVTDVEFMRTGDGAPLAVATVDGSVLIFSETGKLLGVAPGQSRINVMAPVGAAIVVGNREGLIREIGLNSRGVR